jgi:hypothetical protein
MAPVTECRGYGGGQDASAILAFERAVGFFCRLLLRRRSALVGKAYGLIIADRWLVPDESGERGALAPCFQIDLGNDGSSNPVTPT